MGGRLQITALALALVLTASPRARAAEFSACWVTQFATGFGITEQVTRCRIAGGETVDYASDTDVPGKLYPNLGTDITGQCWYLTSAVTFYFIVTQYADGSADIWYDVVPGNPSSAIVIGASLRRCTSEPTPSSDPTADAWDYVISYIHDPPTPDFNPEPGQGVTGLATYVGVEVPDDHTASLTSGGTAVEVEIEVSAVVVRWGDGSTDTYPPIDDILAGYPGGSAQHVYEVKDAEGLPVTVEYDWTARWRLAGGSWLFLPVPNTTTTVIYPIAEIVSRLTN
jgi:hypothetical protein